MGFRRSRLRDGHQQSWQAPCHSQTSQDDSTKGLYSPQLNLRATLTANQTMLNCIDNSGAAIVECAMVVGQKRHASIGTTSPGCSRSLR